ncbi:swarming motility protein SwrB [Oceanobacillus oncorhynchi subsp. incaldanensis]|uniref:Swarming motility protein SwrB n=2 Tax=Oceanobacillus TaxID=182709 RepID=A0A0A1MFV4_9BACI|nr:hypothetical protein [Oceanobacillus oncorhynchi]MDM8099284.1 hypothetical protein [Oceanobacillus oncorhynchi]UUI38585.1 hypothetical protein NP440_14700 [Oceanobacillus oncorhynchi]GIO18404.1 swarming motility protein SwrB [Oceanobacillus oncorhynchi subsp. incaldanensis]CEI84275.1 hypothetical protein BN997_04219 [Oceanobacillus oncorhynchi]
MSTLLWMISFLLHGISILAIYLLLKNRQNANGNKQAENVLKETLEEIRKENRMLQRLLEEDKQPDKSPVKHDSIKKYPPFPPAEKKKEGAAMTEKETQPIEDFQPAAYQDEVETSLEAKILQLHTNGETIDDIAKKLNCGKTEAEIIIKMHQKKS